MGQTESRSRSRDKSSSGKRSNPASGSSRKNPASGSTNAKGEATSGRVQQQIQELIQQQGSRIRPETSRTEATGFHTWSRNDESPRPSRKTKKPELGIPNLAEIITKAFRGRTPGSNQYSSQHSPTTFLTVSPHLGAPAAPTAVGDVEQSRAIFHPLTLCKDERANRRLTRKMWFLGQKPFPQHPRHYTNLTSQVPRKTSRDLQKVAKIKYATKYTPTTKRKFYRHRNMSPANRNSPPVFRPVPATSTRRKRSALSRWSMTAGISSENPRIKKRHRGLRTQSGRRLRRRRSTVTTSPASRRFPISAHSSSGGWPRSSPSTRPSLL